EDRLAAAGSRIRPVAKAHFVRDDVLRIAGIALLRGAEKSEQRAVRPQHARELTRQLLRRRAVEVIHQIPAKNAVNGALGLREAALQEFGKRVELVVSDVAVD